MRAVLSFEGVQLLHQLLRSSYRFRRSREDWPPLMQFDNLFSLVDRRVSRMNAVDTVRLARAASIFFLERLSARVLGLMFAVGLLALIGYCLGHSVFNGQSPHWSASLRWGLAHAAGVGMLLAVACRWPGHHWLLRMIVSFFVGVAGFILVASLLGALSMPAYPMLGIYFLLSLGSNLLLAPIRDQRYLELDFGRSRRLVPTQEFLAAHAARNYIEIEVDGTDSPGLVRMTLEELLDRVPGLLVRTHRSHLVNPTRVRTVEVRPRGALNLGLCNGNVVPVSPRHSAAVRSLIAAVPGPDISSHRTSEML